MAVETGCGVIGGKTAVESVRDVAKQTLTDYYRKQEIVVPAPRLNMTSRFPKFLVGMQSCACGTEIPPNNEKSPLSVFWGIYSILATTLPVSPAFGRVRVTGANQLQYFPHSVLED